MDWKEDPKEEESKESTESNKEEKEGKKKRFVNQNLEPSEMKKILQKFENDERYLDDYVAPFIISTMPPGSNRFYVIKGMNMDDMEEMEEIFMTLYENEVEKVKERAAKDWRKEKKYKEDDAIDEDEIPEMEQYMNEQAALHHQGISSRANDKAVNMIAVLYPEDHKKKVGSNKVPAGDMRLISESVQIASGWSHTDHSIDVYEQDMVEYKQSEKAVKQEEDIYSQLE